MKNLPFFNFNGSLNFLTEINFFYLIRSWTSYRKIINLFEVHRRLQKIFQGSKDRDAKYFFWKLNKMMRNFQRIHFVFSSLLLLLFFNYSVFQALLLKPDFRYACFIKRNYFPGFFFQKRRKIIIHSY